jgi:hypothetical protein
VQIDRVFRKWLKRIPLPLRPEDRGDGYDWDLSIWQMEVSLTRIFDRPLRDFFVTTRSKMFLSGDGRTVGSDIGFL